MTLSVFNQTLVRDLSGGQPIIAEVSPNGREITTAPQQVLVDIRQF